MSTAARCARAPRWLRQGLPALALALGVSGACAISGNEQVRLAGEGEFETLARRLEAENAGAGMSTADRHALCFAYSRLKDYARLGSCLDALEAGARRGDRRTRLFGLDDVSPTISLMRAEAAVDLGRYGEAIGAAQQALDWFARERSDDRDIEISALATTVIAARLAGDQPRADAAYARLDAVDVSWPRNHNFANAKALALARTSLALERYERALAALAGNKGFAVQVFLDNLLSGAAWRGRSNWVWQELPRAYIAARAAHGLGRLDEARAGYDRLLQIAALRVNGEIHWLTLFDRGRIAEDEGDDARAIELYRQAVNVIEAQRATIHTEANKIGFVGNRQAVYERLIRLLLRQRQAGQALEYVERAKSRALVDLLASRLQTAEAVSVQPQAAPALASFLAAEQRSRQQAPVSADAAEAEGRRGDVRLAVGQLREAAPELAALVAVEPMPLAELQRRLGADEALLHFYVAGRDGAVFVVTRAGMQVHAFDAAGLHQAMREHREAMESRSRRINELSGALYRRLLEPALAGVTAASLLIVPHDALHYLSFAALHDGRGYLIDRFALRTLPTAALLRFMHPGAAGGASMLVLGNPDLGNADYDLPNAQQEAQAIARAAPQRQLLLRGAASETAFVEQAPGHRYIHVASHGIFDTERPMDSALLLAPDAHNDGHLTAAELYRLRLKADLVTLSACETGVGQVASGDEVVGLTRGLLYAGASSIVASLWNVDDQATSELMQRFYALLEQGDNDKRQALRQAQLHARQRFPHPFFWAPFQLVGSEK